MKASPSDKLQNILYMHWNPNAAPAHLLFCLCVSCQRFCKRCGIAWDGQIAEACTNIVPWRCCCCSVYRKWYWPQSVRSSWQRTTNTITVAAHRFAGCTRHAIVWCLKIHCPPRVPLRTTLPFFTLATLNNRSFFRVDTNEIVCPSLASQSFTGGANQQTNRSSARK